MYAWKTSEYMYILSRKKEEGDLIYFSNIA